MTDNHTGDAAECVLNPMLRQRVCPGADGTLRYGDGQEHSSLPCSLDARELWRLLIGTMGLLLGALGKWMLRMKTAVKPGPKEEVATIRR